MERFFVYEDELSEGAGYDYFSLEHIMCLTVFILIVILICMFCREGDGHRKDILLKTASVGNLILEAGKDIILAVRGYMNIFELPLHICSLAMFVCLVNAYTGNRRVKEFTGELSAVLLLPAAIAAVIFPDFHKYPVFSFMNIYGYLGHLLITGCIISMLTKVKHEDDISRMIQIKPHISRMYKVVIYIAVTATAMYYFDICFDVNYYFVNWPPADSPLVLLQEWFGVSGYKFGFFGLLVVMVLVMYLIFWIIDVVKERRNVI